jgi:hypothetical protein
MVALTQTDTGSYKARMRLPRDVREEYGRLYGPHLEAKFAAPSGTPRREAERLFHEWQAETKTRIETIRALRKGEGISLTRQQTRALAGKWYDWFVARHSASERDWEDVLNQVQDAMQAAVREKRWQDSDPNELWEHDEELRAVLRPTIADVGETAQFLAAKGMVLNNVSRELFLDFLYRDLAAALKRLIRQADGDYTPDTYRERFPKYEGVDKGETPTQLFERWVADCQPAAGTVENWRYFFRDMTKDFEGRSAGSISADEAQEWLKSLVTKERTARTVKNTRLRAYKAIFTWAVDNKYAARNPFKDVKITVPKR